MRGALNLALAVALGAAVVSAPGRAPEHYSYVGKKCTTKGASFGVILGGAEIGTVTDEEDFAEGSGCTVVPPAGVPTSIGLRCHVDGSGVAHIYASTTLALGATAPAGDWCVEVRTVAPAFVE